MQEIKLELTEKIEATYQHLASEFNTIRSGRANAVLLDKVTVDVYGQTNSLNNIATISSPDPKQLLIQPWDKSNVALIEKAVIDANLGLSISNEGDKIRVTIPPLSNERREELVKLISRLSEEDKVSIRNARREAIEELEKKVKAGGISDDEKDRFKKDFQTLIDNAVEKIDQMASKKSEELRSI